MKRCMCNRVHFPAIFRSFQMQRYKEHCTSRVFMFILIDVRCSSSEYIQLEALIKIKKIVEALLAESATTTMANRTEKELTYSNIH